MTFETHIFCHVYVSSLHGTFVYKSVRNSFWMKQSKYWKHVCRMQPPIAMEPTTDRNAILVTWLKQLQGSWWYGGGVQDSSVQSEVRKEGDQSTKHRKVCSEAIFITFTRDLRLISWNLNLTHVKFFLCASYIVTPIEPLNSKKPQRSPRPPRLHRQTP